ncbi:hypothetical protein DL768_001129 [Monosporascus sp. mg162]|nr:hypothetical protein DL768_001129 [Monosporascus sp. mg162]
MRFISPSRNVEDLFTKKAPLQATTEVDHQRHSPPQPQRQRQRVPRRPEVQQQELEQLQRPQQALDIPPSANASPWTNKSFAFYMSFISLMLIYLVVSWDATSLAVAFPVISKEPHGNTFQSFWASIPFLLGVIVTQRIYSSASDVPACKLPFYLSILLFVAGSALFAATHKYACPRRRPATTGPRWRWIGWVNVPVVGAALVLVILFLCLRFLGVALPMRLRHVDWTGMTLFALGVTCVSLPVTWADLITCMNLCCPYRVLTGTNAVTACETLWCSAAHGLVLYTLATYMPLFFEAVYLETPLAAAVILLLLAISSVAFAAAMPAVPAVIGPTARYRIIFMLEWVLATVFMGVVVHGRARDSPGLRIGLTVRLTGDLVDLAVASAIFNEEFRRSIGAVVGRLPEPLGERLSDARNAIDFVPALRTLELPEDVLAGRLGAYWEAFRGIWIAMACFSGLGLLS